VLDRYNTKLEDMNRKKKEILDKAHADAKILLDGTNKVIENTIRQIKESQAEKDTTRGVRQELEVFKQTVEQQRISEEERINKKIAHIQQKQERRKQKQQDNQDQPQVQQKNQEIKETIDPVIHVGDKVRMIGQNAVGEILEMDGKDAVVSFGQLRTKTKVEKLQKISSTEYKRHNQQPTMQGRSNVNTGIMEKRLHFKSEIDVRGQRADEAMQNVMEFVEQAIVLGVSQIQVLHGKGDGILRMQIRNYLKTVDVVRSFSDAHIELGGAGITVIEIE